MKSNANQPMICPDDVELLQHMLGATVDHRRKVWGFRNHFAPGESHVPAMERLEAAGLVVRGRPYEESNFFHATENGCKVAGLSNAQTDRAITGK